LRARIGLTDEEISRWQDMSHKMFVPFQSDGVIDQFEGYETSRSWTGTITARSTAGFSA
jgi:trehalose/maltose hydrolase-like predicted phosphorylase